MKTLALSAFAMCAGLMATHANADVIFSNVGSPAYQSGSWWYIEGSDEPDGLHNTVAGFQSSGDYSLTELDLGLNLISGTDGMTVSLWTDGGNGLGSQLGSWNVTGLPAAESCCGLTTISGITGITLSAGTSYYLEVAPGAGDTLGGWNFNSAGAQGTVFQTFAVGNPEVDTDTLPAFAVVGDAVPEPASLGLLGAGLAGIGLLRRRR